MTVGTIVNGMNLAQKDMQFTELDEASANISKENYYALYIDKQINNTCV